MKYEPRGREVHLITRPPEHEESTIVATCFNEAWAEVIAGLLQADWESDSHAEESARRESAHAAHNR